MKNVLQFILNLFLYAICSIRNFFTFLWYGTLPKVSVYHQIKQSYDNKEIHQDPHAQSNRNFTPENSINGAWNYLNELMQDEEFTNNVNKIDIPIWDGTKEIGTKSVQILMREILEKHSDKLRTI
jgi:hypothetical protein